MTTYEHCGRVYNLDKFAFFTTWDLVPNSEMPYIIECHTSIDSRKDRIITFAYEGKSMRDYIYQYVIQRDSYKL